MEANFEPNNQVEIYNWFQFRPYTYKVNI